MRPDGGEVELAVDGAIAAKDASTEWRAAFVLVPITAYRHRTVVALRSTVSRCTSAAVIASVRASEIERGHSADRDGDAIWPRLRLWRDANHDGVSQPAELVTLDSQHVSAIGIDHHFSGRRDPFGNLFRYEGKVWLVDERGHERPRPLYDIFFVELP